MKSFIRTVNGDVSVKKIEGYIDSHEHIYCQPSYAYQVKNSDLLLNNINKSIAEVKEYKKNDGSLIIEGTAIDYGRDVNALSEISKVSGIPIVCTSGFNGGNNLYTAIPEYQSSYLGNDYKTYNDWLENTSIDELVLFIKKEVVKGISNTKVKAGQVKFGTSYNRITELEEKTIRIISRVQQLTGAPMYSHTENGTMALEQIKIVEQSGADINHWAIGHLDRNNDYYYYRKIASKGVYMSFDCIGKIKYGSDQDRIDAIIYLIEHGYEDKILIGTDKARKSDFYYYERGTGLSWLLKKWLPRFKEELNQHYLDVDKIVNKLFIINPINYLSFK